MEVLPTTALVELASPFLAVITSNINAILITMALIFGVALVVSIFSSVMEQRKQNDWFAENKRIWRARERAENKRWGALIRHNRRFAKKYHLKY